MSLIVLAGGCTKPASDEPVPVPVLTPAEAESKLQSAFVDAPAEVKDLATAASQALLMTNFEKAVESFEAMKARKDLTPGQYIAVHESEVAMVDRLIAAMQAGDTKARQAYESYQKSRE